MNTGKHWQDIFNILIKETDIVLEILDSRNPTGTHNKMIEDFIKANRPEIEVILILNKSDIIPTKVLDQWKVYFKQQNYTVFSTSAIYKKGVMNLFHHLRTMTTRSNTNILIVGYPNTGKSTLIEALTKNKKKLGTSSSAGFTRVIQKIKLTNNINLLDTPGIIPIDETNETEMAIKSCMVADKLEDPLAVVEAIYKLLPKKKFEDFYNITLDKDDGPEELIQKIGKKAGKLKAGGIVNEPEVEKFIIRDWQANRLIYYVEPPNFKSENEQEKPNNDENSEEKSSGMPPSINNN